MVSTHFSYVIPSIFDDHKLITEMKWTTWQFLWNMDIHYGNKVQW